MLDASLVALVEFLVLIFTKLLILTKQSLKEEVKFCTKLMYGYFGQHHIKIGINYFKNSSKSLFDINHLKLTLNF